MAPNAGNQTLDEIYLSSHTVSTNEIPIALLLSLLLAMILFFVLYAFCCLEAMQGKLDFIMLDNKKSPMNKLKLVNPLTKILANNKRRNSNVNIILDDDLCSVKTGNQTDSDTC